MIINQCLSSVGIKVCETKLGTHRSRHYFQIHYLSCGCLRACICDENTRWGQIPDSESLLHATTVRLRSNGNRWVPRTPPITPPLAAGGESRAGGRADTTYLPRIHRRKSQENTSVVLWRSFPSHTCVVQGFRYALAAVRKAVGAFAASEGGVVAQRCWNTSPR